ncbi:hypothetical protein DSUL_50126 [Desulfovibrionales bacterium]
MISDLLDYYNNYLLMSLSSFYTFSLNPPFVAQYQEREAIFYKHYTHTNETVSNRLYHFKGAGR